MPLDPVPNTTPIVKDELPDFIWKNWFNSLHECISSLQKRSITVTTTPYTAATYKIILVDDDSVGGAATVDLPAAASSLDVIYTVVKMGETAAVTIDSDSGASETINGQSTYPLNGQYDSVEIHCNGTEWVVI